MSQRPDSRTAVLSFRGDVHAGARRDNEPEGRNVPCTIHEPAGALGDEVLAKPAVADRGLPEEPCLTRRSVVSQPDNAVHLPGIEFQPKVAGGPVDAEETHAETGEHGQRIGPKKRNLAAEVPRQRRALLASFPSPADLVRQAKGTTRVVAVAKASTGPDDASVRPAQGCEPSARARETCPLVAEPGTRVRAA